jgi:hypothetical protein
MAEFPIVRAKGTLTEIVPAARADIDVRTGVGLLAQAISGLGKDIEKFELMQASTELSEFKRKVREEHNRLAISYDGNLDPNTFKAEYEKSLVARQALIPKNRFAARAAREWLNDRMPVWAAGVEESRRLRVKDNFRAEGFELKTEAEKTLDSSKYFQHLAVGKKLGGIYGAEEIAKLKAETVENQLVTQKKDLMDRAAVKPKLVSSFIDVELKARSEDKKAFDEFALMSNTDLEAIRDYANSVGEKVDTDSAIAANAAIEDSYAQIIGGNTNIASLITSIQDDPSISEEDSSKAADKIVTFFSKWNSAKVADESNEDVYDELTQASESVERGTMSPAAFEELYADKKGELDRDDQRTIRSKDIVATKTMQNRAFADAMTFTMPTLVELTESDLGALKLARQNAEIIKDIVAVNMFNISIKKNQAERWNFGRFRKQLRSQIDQNPEWSQKQIFTAQEILTEQLDIPVDQLLKEFDAQNPDKAIMKTPPSIDFKDIWPDLSIDDKAKIWELTMRGAPAEVILAEIE